MPTLKKSKRLSRREEREMAEQALTDPRHNLDGFDVADMVKEIESAVTDSGPYLARMERNENTRKCKWPGKNGTGRKRNTTTKEARPWDGAADHEVHLAQEVILQLTALCTASMARGTLNVTPMEGTDTRASAQMKLVMRYYLETAMHGERLINATRWASWARRYGHAVLHVGWKTVKALEERDVSENELVEFVLALEMQRQQQEAGAGRPQAQGQALVASAEQRRAAELLVRETAAETDLAATLLALRPELMERGESLARAEALKCVRELRAGIARGEENARGSYFAAFIKENRPTWSARRTGVDFFCPAETLHEETLDNARWLADVKWLSVQQIREQAALRDWDPVWVLEVTTKHKGKAALFTDATKCAWALSGLSVGLASSDRRNTDLNQHLCQVVELYDKRVTEDGVQCLYRTVLHPDVTKTVAKRELLPDWHGHYPFVATTNEQDEPLLLENRGVPEIVFSPQNAIKTQWDSRDDMASLSTMPPWTGPETLASTVIAPGAFIPEWRTGAVSPFKLPPPDGRSIEIESTLRASVDRYFGLISKSVPEALSRLLGQSGTDWFLTSYNRAVALTAQIVQQRMPRLTGARITNTEIVFDATREGVRGNFDFRVKFDVNTLDLEWFQTVLNSVKEAMMSFDNRGLTDRRVLLEMFYNMIDPGLADRALQSDEEVTAQDKREMEGQLNTIFSGGVPEFIQGVNYSARAEMMKRDLQGSPVRQQILQTNPMIAQVWQDYLQKLLFQTEQETTNKQAGIEGGSDPLRQSPLARLKAGGWQGVVGGG